MVQSAFSLGGKRGAIYYVSTSGITVRSQMSYINSLGLSFLICEILPGYKASNTEQALEGLSSLT